MQPPSGRSRRYFFIVSIFRADTPVEFPQTDRLSIPLTRLFAGAIAANDHRQAAAKAWIKHVGQYRQQRLVALLAMAEIAKAQVDLFYIADELIPSSLCPVDGGYMLDNQREAWFISVRRAKFTVKQRTGK